MSVANSIIMMLKIWKYMTKTHQDCESGQFELLSLVVWGKCCLIFWCRWCSAEILYTLLGDLEDKITGFSLKKGKLI